MTHRATAAQIEASLAGLATMAEVEPGVSVMRVEGA